MALRVQLACWHVLWPRGDASLYEKGTEVYCSTCRTRRPVIEVGQVSTC